MKEDRTAYDTESTAQSRTNYIHRILVVDDDSGVRELGVETLVHMGYIVDAAEDGGAGWEALQAKRYDLLITDNNMPNLTGVELVAKLRSAHMDLPVILASGAMPEEELDRQPWLHLSARLAKPYTIHELTGTVQEILSPLTPPRISLA